MKGILWSIRKPHTDNIISGIKWDEIRKQIPKDLSPLMLNYIYETKGNGGCGKVIGEFRVYTKTYIYAWEENGKKHLGNTAFIMPALSDDELYDYLCSGKNKDGWALRIEKLKIYEKPKELSEFKVYEKNKCPAYLNGKCLDRTQNQVILCINLDCDCKKIVRPPQSYMFIESLGE